MSTQTDTEHPFHPGARVKVYNGGKLEGWAVIKAPCETEHDYHVRFDGDLPREFYRRTVMPEWQSPDYTPLAPEPAICPQPAPDPHGWTNTDLDASTTVCDACGDESNSTPGMPCGREDDGTVCQGTYRTSPAERERTLASPLHVHLGHAGSHRGFGY